MKYFEDLIAHIMGFLSDLLEKVREFLGLVDLATQKLEDASETQSSVAAELD